MPCMKMYAPHHTKFDEGIINRLAAPVMIRDRISLTRRRSTSVKPVTALGDRLVVAVQSESRMPSSMHPEVSENEPDTVDTSDDEICDVGRSRNRLHQRDCQGHFLGNFVRILIRHLVLSFKTASWRPCRGKFFIDSRNVPFHLNQSLVPTSRISTLVFIADVRTSNLDVPFHQFFRIKAH